MEIKGGPGRGPAAWPNESCLPGHAPASPARGPNWPMNPKPGRPQPGPGSESYRFKEFTP